MATMNYSGQQIEFFAFLERGVGNGILESVAGSGKTTTIIEGLDFIDDTEPVLLCSFTKLIAEELQKRVTEKKFNNVTSATLNSIGWSIYRKAQPGVKLNKFKSGNILEWFIRKEYADRDKDFTNALIHAVKNPVCRLISLLKSNLVIPENAYVEAERLMKKHDIDEPEGNSEVAIIARAELLRFVYEVYVVSIKTLFEADFDDQKFMPVFHNWVSGNWKWIFVDEAQDMNRCDIEFVALLSGKGTRVIFVGDSHQAIYGFRGSLTDSMNLLEVRFKCLKLALSVCWRCPTTVIAEAQKINPKITGPSNNKRGEGEVKRVETSDFLKHVSIGDYVVCRTSAPLVKRCFQLIREGTPAQVKGKDIGRNLLELLSEVTKKYNLTDQYDIEGLASAIRDHQTEMVKKFEQLRREEAAIAVSDKCEALYALLEENFSFREIEQTIETMFTEEPDDTKVVLFLTGHKCKGLQRNRVWMLRPDLCPHPRSTSGEALQQEMNLKYVMVTRAENMLAFVNKERDEK